MKLLQSDGLIIRGKNIKQNLNPLFLKDILHWFLIFISFTFIIRDWAFVHNPKQW